MASVRTAVLVAVVDDRRVATKRRKRGVGVTPIVCAELSTDDLRHSSLDVTAMCCVIHGRPPLASVETTFCARRVVMFVWIRAS
jgi:hypothetical protein